MERHDHLGHWRKQAGNGVSNACPYEEECVLVGFHIEVELLGANLSMYSSSAYLDDVESRVRLSNVRREPT